MKKTDIQLKKISQICKVIEDILDNKIPSILKVGLPLVEIRSLVEKEFAANNISTILNFVIDGYIVDDVCHISQSNQVVHGDGSCDSVVEGILKVDLVGFKDGLYGDAARSYVVGECENKEEMLNLVASAKDAFDNVMNFVKTGDNFYKISKTIHNAIKKDKYFVSQYLCGHGIGEKLHEAPSVMNVYSEQMTKNAYFNFLIEKDMVFAIEPVIFSKDAELDISDDKAELSKTHHVPIITRTDGCLIAHYENTIYFDENGPRLVSSYYKE